MPNKTKVLIVEDDEVSAMLISETLLQFGYEISGIAESDGEARDTALAVSPDVVLMDVHLNGAVTGVETAEWVSEALDVPVIFLTGDRTELTLDSACRVRPYGYLLKPCTGRELHATIQLSRQRHRVEQDLRASQRQLDRANRELRREIEERQYYEEQLLKVQKLRAIGNLSTGIAHEFNTILAVVQGNIEMVLQAPALADSEDCLTMLGDAAAAVRRGSLLVNDLLTFAGHHTLGTVAVHLTPLLSRISEVLRQTWTSDVEIQTELPDDLWAARTDPRQLENVFFDLAFNARDAMPEGGRLTITASNRTLDDTARHAELPRGDYVVVTVQDTGIGMEPEVLKHALEPFFTTKRPMRTGLGLSTSYGFARQAGGDLVLESSLGRGTTVRLVLPRALPDRPPVCS